jgi:hypothetical protein
MDNVISITNQIQEAAKVRRDLVARVAELTGMLDSVQGDLKKLHETLAAELGLRVEAPKV